MLENKKVHTIPTLEIPSRLRRFSYQLCDRFSLREKEFEVLYTDSEPDELAVLERHSKEASVKYTAVTAEDFPEVAAWCKENVK